MGARQRGQLRSKKKNDGNNKGSPMSQKQLNSSLKVHSLDASTRHRALLADWQDFSDAHSSHQKIGFTMSQEARNTERHAPAWGSTRLRDQAIAFVSAGNLVRDELELPEDAQEELQEDKDFIRPAPPPDVVPVPQRHVDIVPEVAPTVDSTAAKKTARRRESILSQSSEEIVFTGRSNRNPPKDQARDEPKDLPTLPAVPIPESSSEIGPPPDPIVTPAKPTTSSDPYANIYTSERKRVVDRRGRPMIRNHISDDQELIMRDYIANMVLEDDDDDDDDDEDMNDELGRPHKGNEHYRFFDGSADINVKVQTRGRNPHKERAPIDQAIDWNSSDLEDFDDFSTTDEDITEVSQVLRHRIRPSGSQYLVTALGQAAADAKWVLGRNLKTPSALDEIRIYEDIRAMKVQESTGDSDDVSDSDDDIEALDDLIGDIDSEDDENDRIIKHTARMTDEQIAQALAKQEELGMGGDELLIFDGQVADEDDDEFANELDFIPFSGAKHLSNRGKSKRNRRQKDNFPPAAAFADALEQDPYGAFDIMDFNRPSLRLKRKGRKTDFPFDLGDEDQELAEQLRNQWHKDREKKASRKREKQAERDAILFDAAERNQPEAIKAEIRRFLISETQILELAPMDSALRASVHRLAKALKLNSRSQGKDGHGIGRFPVLTKTSGTRYYTIDNVWEVDNLMNLRKFFPKRQGGSYRGPNAVRTPAVARTRRGGGGVMSGATYMNGDIVGASAPEIGIENKGRAMLEKMGWTSGMGIGAVGNKGGIEVIKHVVKTTKAGLG